MKKYVVRVYSGYAHWDKPIKELEECFETLEEAVSYVRGLNSFRPEYRKEISFE